MSRRVIACCDERFEEATHSSCVFTGWWNQQPKSVDQNWQKWSQHGGSLSRYSARRSAVPANAYTHKYFHDDLLTVEMVRLRYGKQLG